MPNYKKCNFKALKNVYLEIGLKGALFSQLPIIACTGHQKTKERS